MPDVVAFLMSVLSQVFLRDSWLRNFLYDRFTSGAVLSGCRRCHVWVLSRQRQSDENLFSAMLFAMLLGVPSGVGWLFGWPIAIILRLVARGLPDPAAEKS